MVFIGFPDLKANREKTIQATKLKDVMYMRGCVTENESTLFIPGSSGTAIKAISASSIGTGFPLTVAFHLDIMILQIESVNHPVLIRTLYSFQLVKTN